MRKRNKILPFNSCPSVELAFRILFARMERNNFREFKSSKFLANGKEEQKFPGFIPKSSTETKSTLHVNEAENSKKPELIKTTYKNALLKFLPPPPKRPEEIDLNNNAIAVTAQKSDPILDILRDELSDSDPAEKVREPRFKCSSPRKRVPPPNSLPMPAANVANVLNLSNKHGLLPKKIKVPVRDILKNVGAQNTELGFSNLLVKRTTHEDEKVTALKNTVLKDLNGNHLDSDDDDDFTEIDDVINEIIKGESDNEDDELNFKSASQCGQNVRESPVRDIDYSEVILFRKALGQLVVKPKEDIMNNFIGIFFLFSLCAFLRNRFVIAYVVH